MKKKNSDIKIKNVTGNIVITQGQQGGVTAHDIAEKKEESKIKSFFKIKYVRLISFIVGVIGFIASVLGILDYFGCQPETNKANDLQKITNAANSSDTSRQGNIPTIKTKPNTQQTMKNNEEENKNKQTPISVKNVNGDVVISQNQTGGITAHTINYGIPPRQITESSANELIADLKKYPAESFRISCIMNNSESFRLAQNLEQILKLAGWKGSADGIEQKIFNEPIKNVLVEVDKRRSSVETLVNWFQKINFKPIGHTTPVGDTVEVIVGENL